MTFRIFPSVPVPSKPVLKVWKINYQHLWDTMEIKNPSVVSVAANRLLKSKARYQQVSSQFPGMPWDFVAVIHWRESGQDGKSSLAQGDPWNKVSTHVPKGRGPFASWTEAAIDALTLKGYQKVLSWSLPETLERLEGYNGWGYRNRGISSPYLWSFTNHYVKGKYVADGVFNANAVDKQLGCAPLLKVLRG